MQGCRQEEFLGIFQPKIHEHTQVFLAHLYRERQETKHISCLLQAAAGAITRQLLLIVPSSALDADDWQRHSLIHSSAGFVMYMFNCYETVFLRKKI